MLEERLAFVRGAPWRLSRLRDWQRNVAMWPSTVSDQGKAICFLCRLTEYPPEGASTFLLPAEWYSVSVEQEDSHVDPARRDVGDVPICPSCAQVIVARVRARACEQLNGHIRISSAGGAWATGTSCWRCGAGLSNDAGVRVVDSLAAAEVQGTTDLQRKDDSE